MTDPNKARNDQILAEFKSKILQQMNDSIQGGAYEEAGKTKQPSRVGNAIDGDYISRPNAHNLPRCNSEGKDPRPHLTHASPEAKVRMWTMDS